MRAKSPCSWGETSVIASPLCLRAAGATHAMDVVLRHPRDVEVHHVPELVDVDAARRDVGRHEHAVLAALEALERLGALALGAVAVDALGIDALAHEPAGQPVGAMLGAREDERVADLAALEQRREERRLQLGGDRVGGVRDGLGGRGAAAELDLDRIAQQLARQLLRSRGGMVALKNRVCFSGGRWRRMRFTSGRKPMSSMRSASSRTRTSRPASRA